MEVDNLRCSDCRNGRCCPNLRNTRVQPAKAHFCCRADPVPCLKFEPVFKVYEDQTKDMRSWWTEFEEQWLPKPVSKCTIALVVDGDTTVRYRLHLQDWINGTLFEGNKVRVFEKIYYRRTRTGCGLRLVTEQIDGIVLEGEKEHGSDSLQDAETNTH